LENYIKDIKAFEEIIKTNYEAIRSLEKQILKAN
jgi:hypothetical protein